MTEVPAVEATEGSKELAPNPTVLNAALPPSMTPQALGFCRHPLEASSNGTRMTRPLG